MKNNDRFLLDNIISERVSKMIPSSDKGEVFEFLTYQQKLKDYDLSIDELLSGSVDGRNDGGPGRYGGYRNVLRSNKNEAETVWLMHYMLLNGRTLHEIEETRTELGGRRDRKRPAARSTHGGLIEWSCVSRGISIINGCLTRLAML